MGFKEDADFARFVSMGAVGSAAVARDLRDKHGHTTIELERYAMANKVWQTKVKRLRLPDLVCTSCGLRVESRAKSRLGLILSHSDAPGREWDAGGMRDGDLYAFLRADLSTFPPVVSTPIYFTTRALRDTVGQAKRSAPKAASEGSEVMLTWPSWVPSKDGVFVEVDAEGRVVCKWDDGTTLRYWQWRKWSGERYVYLSPGEPIDAGETVVAGVVAPATDLACAGDVWDIRADMTRGDPSDRYAAVKAAGATTRRELLPDLEAIAEDAREDWRIRLEAYASLARIEPDDWTEPIRRVVLDSEADPEQQMEAVLILSEIPSDDAASALFEVATSSLATAEVRAAAAWGLGQGSDARPDLVLPVTLDRDPFVALHAITAIEALPDELVPTLIDWMEEDDHRAAIAAYLLQRHRKVTALLDAIETSDAARMPALRALGDLPPPLVRLIGGDRVTPELAEILAPMWHGQTDWLRLQGQDGLAALDVQKVRFDPLHPE